MRTFRIDAEAAAAQKKDKWTIPTELSTVEILDRTGWTYADLLRTPQHIIDELLLLWNLKHINQQAQQPKAKKKNLNGK